MTTCVNVSGPWPVVVAKGGSVQSFDEAFVALHRAAYRVAYKLLGERAEAEDVAQEALARALVRWRKV
jgi:DNA-directed RNA polymerase specialized sigma24 family protein